MRKTSAGSNGGRRNQRQETPGRRNTGKHTSREARPDKRNREDKPYKKDSRPSREDNRPSRENRSYQKDTRPSREDKPYQKDSRPSREDNRPSRENRSYQKDSRSSREDRPYQKDSRPSREDRPYQKESRPSRERPFQKDRSATDSRREKPASPYSRDRKKSADDSQAREKRFSKDRPFKKERYTDGPEKVTDRPKFGRKPAPRKDPADDSIRLNKYIANAGVCSRREADMLIKNGAITVNDEIVTEMGIKVKPGDVVKYGNERLINEKKVYVLLNKPKDYITTSDDPQERKTVMDLIRGACPERIYPVGRLDRNTTGLLLLTNDGELAKKLTHPRHGVSKLYHVHLDQPVKKADLESIAQGVKIEDNLVVPDAVSYIDRAENKKEIGIEIHSGQNRIVRRIFEHFGYKVTKLDRVTFAGLTKRDLPRGRWRFLSEKEVNFLKMIR
ncbi:MAG: pseudouridine synthase [Bacteroides sp.]|nr:pseudouridine synthase [Bacteroides sp.]